MRLGAPHHPHAPPILNDALRYLRAWTVETVKRSSCDVQIELRPVGGDLRLKSVEDVLRQAPRIGRRLNHERRHRADQYGLGNATFAVARDVTRDLAAPGGMSNMDGVLEIEVRG